MNESDVHIFISYSRVDQSLVTPIVQVFRAVGAGVHHDIDSIPYGRRWRPVIEESIDRAAVTLVFWCAHSRDSVEVRTEWERAIQADKAVVPVLLDDTPMEPALAEFQGIDLRVLAATHGGGAGGRGLLPVGRDRWMRRNLDVERARHLRTADPIVAREVALDILAAVDARIRPRGGPGGAPRD
jgi:hypothetical protein